MKVVSIFWCVFLLLVLGSHAYDMAYNQPHLVELERVNDKSNSDAVMKLSVDSELLEKQGFSQPRIKDMWAVFGNDVNEEISWNDDKAVARFLSECKEEESNSKDEEEEQQLTIHSKPACSNVMRLVEDGDAVSEFSVQIVPEELMVKFRITSEHLHAGKPLHVHTSIENFSDLQRRDVSSSQSPTYHLYARRNFEISSSTEKIPSTVRSSKRVSSIDVDSDVTNSTNTGLIVLTVIIGVTAICMAIGLFVGWMRTARAMEFR